MITAALEVSYNKNTKFITEFQKSACCVLLRSEFAADYLAAAD